MASESAAIPLAFTNELEKLLALAHEGSWEAAQTLFDRYSRAILRVVRRRLEGHRRQLGRILDSWDVVQDFWANLLRTGMEQDRFESPQALLAFLKVMAENQVNLAVRKYLSQQKNNLSREVSFDSPEVCEERDLVDRRPSASELSVARETQEQVRAHLGPLSYFVLELLQQGYTQFDIGRIIGRSERTVGRIVSRIAEALRASAGESPQ